MNFLLDLLVGEVVSIQEHLNCDHEGYRDSVDLLVVLKDSAEFADELLLLCNPCSFVDLTITILYLAGF